MPKRSHVKFWKVKMPSKELSEMTLDELWQLFPISLVEHDGKWKAQYEDMEKSLAELLSDYPVERISHVGSTAVAGIWAKDIVDVLVELAPGTSMEAVAKALERAGFIVMSSDGARVSLNLGYTKAGFAKKVFHVHLRHAGDNDELYFRDYLNDHPQLAREYEALKLQLWKQFEHDRDAYTNGKSDFIATITDKAKEEYVGRY